MAQIAGMKKKTDLLDVINEWIERASKTKQGFTPEVVAGFYKEGLRARENKEAPVQRLVEATPKKQMPVAVRMEKPPEEKRNKTQEVRAAVNLAEMLELAVRGTQPNFRRWVKEG